jgi:hypothetical protein
MTRIKKFIGLISFISFTGAVFAQVCDKGLAPSQCPNKPDFPHEITRLIPRGFDVLDYLAGQLTDPGRIDYLVVVHHSDDSAQNPSPRPLLIYTALPDGTFQLSARNDAVVMRADDGGVSGDPYTDSGDGGLAIKNLYFTVQQGVAGGPNHWTDYVTFHYDTQRHTWLFHKEIFTDEQPALGDPPKPAEVKVTRADTKHPITFADWRPDYWCKDYAHHEKDDACQRH